MSRTNNGPAASDAGTRTWQQSKLRATRERGPKFLAEAYGLSENPFGVTPDPRYLYESNTHLEAKSSLIVGIECAVGFQALIAPPGMGKTTLLCNILERFDDVARTAFLFQTQGNSRDFLRYLISELGGEAPDSDLVRMQETINDLLIRERRAGRQTIVIIDEAQNLSPAVLETLRLLSNFETSTDKLLHIILAGQPQLAQKLSSPDAAQLSQRICILTTLEPFSLEDTGKYIQHRLKVAGYQGPPLFSPEAVVTIWKRSGGIPREINKVCFNCLLLARAAKKHRVEAAVLREVTADLDLDRVQSRRPVRLNEMLNSEAAGTPQPGSQIAESLAVRIDSLCDAPAAAVVTWPKGNLHEKEPPRHVAVSPVNTDTAPDSDGAAVAVSPQPAEAKPAQLSSVVVNGSVTVAPQFDHPPSDGRPDEGAPASVSTTGSDEKQASEPDAQAANSADAKRDPTTGANEPLAESVSDSAQTGAAVTDDTVAQGAADSVEVTAQPDAAFTEILELKAEAEPEIIGHDADVERDATGSLDTEAGGAIHPAQESTEFAEPSFDNSGEEEEITDDSAEATLLVREDFAELPWTRGWLRQQWRAHHATVYLGLAGLALLLALLWVPHSAPRTEDPGRTAAENSATAPNLAAPFPPPDYRPKARVWLDVQTQLYYCPGSPLYGTTQGGKFTTQQDAHLQHFDPASAFCQ